MFEFDPYHRWLGIAPGPRPPDHYRLLGIPCFESDPEVISSAADRQMAHVRSLQSGKHVELTQQLLNELSAARVCLLSPRRKAEYDERLRQASAPPPQPDAEPVVVAASPPLVSVSPAARRRGPARGVRPPLVWAGVACGALAGVAAVIWIVVAGLTRTGTIVVEVPAGGRSELQVAIDGQAQALPAQGEIRFSLPGGMHTIRASRPAHEAWEQSVEVIAGTTQAVSIQLRALARLMIELPGKRPDNFQVSVDGRPRQVPSGKLMVVPCEPGTHTVRATSAKGQFERLVAVSLHQDLPVVVAILAESRLAGGWSGQIEIDAQAVERKLNEAKANPLQRALTQQLVAALSAGRMEIEFQPDGSYRIHTQLGSLSSNSGGQWVIAEESSRRVVVELTPQSGPVELRQITFVDENTFTTDLPSKAAGFGCFRCVRTDRR